MNLNRKQFKTDFNGKSVTLEISAIGEQANAAIVGRYGKTVVLATVVLGAEDRDIDYFPLTVDYEEKFYAVGKIMGGQYVRREGRASENAILSARLIDRTIRPLFDHNLRRDVQVVVTILSLDSDYDAHFIGLLTASTAIAISDVPWGGPVAGLTVASIGGQTMINPSVSDLKEGFVFDLFASGTEDKINMIEMEGIDASEEEIAAGLEIAQKEIASLIKFQKDIVKEIGLPKIAVPAVEIDSKLRQAVKQFLKNKLEAAVYTKTKTVRQNNLAELQKQMLEKLEADGFEGGVLGFAEKLFEEELDQLVHQNILEKDQRPDLRRLDEVRELYSEVGLLERVHGSALFIRGNTQSLALTTLGPPEDEQSIQSVEFEGKRRFILHYNFPPYATGETGFFRGPGRREIGHGSLAEKALRNLIPSKDAFPYTIRVVSEILSSNGSSSMASVCAGCLSLMDAGVPIKKMAAGVAMGLIIGDQISGDGIPKYKILTDIQGPEDHYGDMDFKIAGTADGVTALQMDVKIGGITAKIAGEVLAQAKAARLHILENMAKTLLAPRKELSPYAPTIFTIAVNPEKIGLIIGPGGKTINGIIAKTGALGIDIDQSGKVYVYGDDRAKTEAALRTVEGLVKEYKVGDVIEGTVVKILDFGAIVEFGVGQSGMIHVSELRDGYVKNVSDVVKLDQLVRAKIVRMEDGKTGLTLRNVK